MKKENDLRKTVEMQERTAHKEYYKYHMVYVKPILTLEISKTWKKTKNNYFVKLEKEIRVKAMEKVFIFFFRRTENSCIN